MQMKLAARKNRTTENTICRWQILQNVADTKQLLRIIQAIPSPKAAIMSKQKQLYQALEINPPT